MSNPSLKKDRANINVWTDPEIKLQLFRVMEKVGMSQTEFINRTLHAALYVYKKTGELPAPIVK